MPCTDMLIFIIRAIWIFYDFIIQFAKNFYIFFATTWFTDTLTDKLAGNLLTDLVANWLADWQSSWQTRWETSVGSTDLQVNKAGRPAIFRLSFTTACLSYILCIIFRFSGALHRHPIFNIRAIWIFYDFIIQFAKNFYIFFC